jgi:hypothetical protein
MALRDARSRVHVGLQPEPSIANRGDWLQGGGLAETLCPPASLLRTWQKSEYHGWLHKKKMKIER